MVHRLLAFRGIKEAIFIVLQWRGPWRTGYPSFACRHPRTWAARVRILREHRHRVRLGRRSYMMGSGGGLHQVVRGSTELNETLGRFPFRPKASTHGAIRAPLPHWRRSHPREAHPLRSATCVEGFWVGWPRENALQALPFTRPPIE